MLDRTNKSEAPDQAARWQPVYDALHEAIISRRLAPGTKLPEDELGSIFSVSRTVVRSALQALAHDRVVRLERNRGAFVAQPTIKEAREVFDARKLIEPRIAALAARLATPEDIRSLRQHLEDERDVMKSDRSGEAIRLSAHFHLKIARIADHSIFTEILRDLISRSSLIIALYWRSRDTTCKCDAHRNIVEALAAGDGAEASALMKKHIADLFSGLDLTPTENKPQRLADILGKCRV
ncbi:MAG: GntR family transcriptional regulator [Proteobacteria bacterium]|nr:MAG: GntR family transcriptional regulator [Pseudomonadota bacterium]